MAVAFEAEPGLTRVQRVTVKASLGDPERHNAPAMSQFEFVALAALENGRLIAGRRASAGDLNFSLKTIALHRSGALFDAELSKQVDGRELLEACRRGAVTPAMEDEVLRQHFTMLRDEALLHAGRRVNIKKLILSYPCYLHRRQREGDFAKFVEFLLRLICPIWAGQYLTDIEMVSEGQATTLYITEEFDDPLGLFRRADLWDSISDMNKREGMNLVVVDSGSSSLVCTDLRAGVAC